ncbi:MAG TPA: hypothetical protein VJP77_05235, partial [Planctomycetota bacterium]|nr:hypothetical protein [Planctomycetota bacterium]
MQLAPRPPGSLFRAASACALFTGTLAGALAGSAPTALAQTGPWADGELLIRSIVLETGQAGLFRVDPESGAAALLTLVNVYAGFSGGVAFDPHRSGVLINMTVAQDPFVYRLYFVDSDGTPTAVPGFTGQVRALAPTGDGRVYFVRHTGATQGPKPIEYFDPADQIQTLWNADGVTPFQADVEHLIYHPATNALIGCSTQQHAATHCGPTGNSLYRFPLSADGTRVEGTPTCAAVPTTLTFGDFMSLDLLPDGQVLVTAATAFLGAPHGMLAVDPLTLAAANWALPAQHDINGGYWSERLGQAVHHANSGTSWWEPDGLRRLSAGATGFGTHVPTSLPLPLGGGFSPIESLTEVDTNGPTCAAIQVPYGAGLAGHGGFVPQLGVIGCLDIGNPFTVAVNNVNGGAPGLLAVSASSGALPLFGGTLHLGPIALTLP